MRTHHTAASLRTLATLCALLAATALLAAGCDSHDDHDHDSHSHGASDTSGDGQASTGEGDFSLTIFGEDFIEDGIPAEVFSDGWAVTFDKFVVVVSAVAVEPDGAAAVPVSGAFAFDLAQPSTDGHSLSAFKAPAGHYAHMTYTLAPATDITGGNAAAADVDMMKAQGVSIYVVGAATKGATTKTFSWSFQTSTTYQECELAAPHLDANQATTAQITIHADHLFYDDLESEEPNVAFDLIASADADSDGAVTLAELAAIDISALSRYQVGSRPVKDLRAFIEALTATVGHIDGEGHCETQP